MYIRTSVYSRHGRDRLWYERMRQDGWVDNVVYNHQKIRPFCEGNQSAVLYRCVFNRLRLGTLNGCWGPEWDQYTCNGTCIVSDGPGTRHLVNETIT